MLHFLKTAAMRLGLNLGRSETKPSPVRSAYADAYGAYQNALRRGDTRDQGEAWQRLRSAMNDNLKAEIRRAPQAWRGL
jgi:hypothetical protein